MRMRISYHQIPFIYRRLRQHQRFSPTALRQLQDQKLRAIVKHCAEHVPYYQRLFRDAKVDPEAIRSVDDLSKIPITTKAMIRQVPLHELQATNVPLKNCVKLETSGTSGIPLSIYWDIDALLENKLNMLLLQLDCGDGIFNKRIESHMWTMRFPQILQRLGIFRTKYISPFAAVPASRSHCCCYSAVGHLFTFRHHGGECKRDGCPLPLWCHHRKTSGAGPALCPAMAL